ncbi:uncharacterized protein yc1106_09289 [Curvularia clavata]|uniref:Uncharacterized protein n=1 Tax=Curvularia clavata TaxID=95742 RepID=A0A9Q9DXJ5_CURCL|nr:uncharacterized protein yc1106_09289 [Curvularia clavata]
MASAVKVQYYSDGGCSNYLVEFHPSPAGECYNYEYSNQHSANIASCEGSRAKCSCTFYEQRNCKGKSWKATYGGNNCASNWDGGGHKSVACLVLVTPPIGGGRS